MGLVWQVEKIKKGQSAQATGTVFAHSGRYKDPPTTGEFAQLIYLFYALGPRRAPGGICGVLGHRLSLRIVNYYSSNPGSPE